MFEKFDFDHWWKGAATAGTAITVAAAAVQLVPLVILGLGVVALGLGEWINHPKTQEMVMGSGMRGVATRYNRSNSAIGIVLDLVGMVTIIYGGYRLVTL